jgi:hypothetical protein
MLIDEDGNRILGFTAFIAGGGDLIAVVQTAMLSGVEFPALRDAIFTHPTMPEGLNLLLSGVEVKQRVAGSSDYRAAGTDLPVPQPKTNEATVKLAG